MTRRLLNLLTALSTAVGLCASPQTAHAQRGGEPPEVIHLVRGGDRLFVKTSVGGQDVGYFGIDTGSDWTHLSAATAKRLNPKPLGETNYENDRGGTDREPVAWLDEIQLDAIKRPHWPIAVSKNLGPIHGGEVAGIFGTDVCRGKPFTLDFHDATLTIWDPRSFVPPAGAREFPLREFRGTPLVQCTVEGITSWFVLDSGRPGAPLLGASLWKLMLDGDENRWLVNRAGHWAAESAVMETQVRRLECVGRSFDNIYVACQVGGTLSGAAGLISASVVRDARVAVDTAGRRIWVTPDEREPVKDLVGRLGRPDSQDLAGWTPLIHAAIRKRPDAVKVMLERGDAPDLADDFGTTPLIVAAARDDGESLRLLLAHKADPARRMKGTWDTALLLAAEYGRANAVKQLLDAGADVEQRPQSGRAALFLAADGGHADVVRLLLDRGAKPNAHLPTGDTALLPACRSARADLVKLLLDHGADPNIPSTKGSALTYAARSGDPDCLRLLLAKGADVNARDATGTTPLIAAAASFQGSRLVEALLDAGADPNTPDLTGQTALNRAIAGGGSPEAVALLRTRAEAQKRK